MTKNQQPNSKNCFVCGLENPVGLKLVFYDNGEDLVWCNYTFPKHFEGYPGVGHGGIVATILDETVGRVAMIKNPENFMMTVKIEVKYRNPVPLETDLHVTGEMIKHRGRLAQAKSYIRVAGTDTILAEAAATLATVPTETIAGGANAEELGWKVYDNVGS